MKPFLFARGPRHYARFYIPQAQREQFSGRQYLVIALGAGHPSEIRLKACMLEVQLLGFVRQGVKIDWDKIRKFEIDLGRGVFKADGPEDHQAMMETLALLQPAIQNYKAPIASAPVAPPKTAQGLLLPELLTKFFLLKKVSPATVKGYTLAVEEFVRFYKGKCYVAGVVTADVTRFREHLGEKGNTPRTIDKKIGVLKMVFNFAIEQNYYQGKNPAQVKNLLTKRQKVAGGYLIFEAEEVRHIFTSEYFRAQKEQDPDYYLACLLVLFTGARHDEITQLCRAQVKVSEAGTNYIQIRASKTTAGIREVPIPAELMEASFAKFIEGKKGYEQIFRYKAGNAVGKKFSRQIKEVEKINRGKLVLHSLRKFLNDLMMKNGVSMEARCQFIGHELDNVNVTTYANKFNVDELEKFTFKTSFKIMHLCGINQNNGV